jgi:hypothetical protein
MPPLRTENSFDGFEIRLYDYGVNKEGKRRLFLKAISESRPNEDWNIYFPDSPDYKAIADEIFEVLKFQG